MGPWLCSHGKPASREPLAVVFVASMGPWLCSHGEASGNDSAAYVSQLQWGRGFAATERRSASRHGRTSGSFNGAVALQPRRGCPRAQRLAEEEASMGPWLCSHGEARATAIRAAVAMLQWGRGFAATERRRGGSVTSRACSRFNGAVALQPRRGPGLVLRVRLHRASMGPWLCSHGEGGVGSRFVPRSQSDICEHPGAQSTSSKPFHHHGLRKPFPASQLAPRERPPGFWHHVAARDGLSNKPNCQGSTSRQRLTAS